MSKKDEKVNEDVKIDVIIDVEPDDENYNSADQDDLQDDSGKILNNHYSYYDIIHTCWREMRDYVVTKQAPLCEYMTVYNFIDFVDNV